MADIGGQEWGHQGQDWGQCGVRSVVGTAAGFCGKAFSHLPRNKASSESRRFVVYSVSTSGIWEREMMDNRNIEEFIRKQEVAFIASVDDEGSRV